MSQASSIEQRLAHIEEDVTNLRSEFNRVNARRNWVDQIVASGPEYVALSRRIARGDRSWLSADGKDSGRFFLRSSVVVR